jgi:sterol desaturase/sphingolipid hydroxylase (fatty acid hydroxylase superfamily)
MIYVLFISSTVFLLLFLIERVDPLRQLKHNLLKRLIVNSIVTTLTFLVYLSVVQPTAGLTMQWTAQSSFGLLHWIKLPAIVGGTIAFLLMDLSFYYWHRSTHQFAFLWRFHLAHHIDPDLDVSNGFRFHFGEIFFSTGFRILQVALIGLSLQTYLVYELAFQANTMFHHSNVKLPLRLERGLNFVLVTPRMHGIHHSQLQQETNANFSSVFPWWDRLHGTLRLNVPQSMITIGVPAYDHPDDNTIQNVLLLPFRQQRDDWGRTKNVTRDPAIVGDDPIQMIDVESAGDRQQSLTDT